MSRKNKSDSSGSGSGAHVIAGAIGLTIGFVLLWLIVASAWGAMFGG